LLSPAEFHELVSGRRRGPKAALTRALLRTLEVPYTAAVRLRNWRYDTGRATIHRSGVPVVSVGNITLGGTGKTPTVEWLVRWFAERGVRAGIVSRGYGAEHGRPNDEALELAEKLPGVPHVQDADRVRGARRAVEECGCQLLVLDDGFQHRRLARDFDLVLVDALEPFGFDHLVPRGTLREPLAGWHRADALMLTRAELADETQRAAIRARAMQLAPEALWLEATHAPRALRAPGGAERPLTSLAGQRVVAFCGIGNPAGFRHALAGCHFDVVAAREFADHMAYSAQNVREIAAWADRQDASAVVCTHKDLVKVGPQWQAAKPLWALSGQLQILTGQDALAARLEELARRALAAR
jgi:tetraacyldisaccharide 4'-kinase